MSINIQLVVIIGLPIFLIYSTLLFCYGYKQGHDAGIDIAMQLRDIDDKAESEK
jgi:hypothetical protein